MNPAVKQLRYMARQKPIKRTGLKRSKYGNVKSTLAGRSFASGLERTVYLALKEMEREGKIVDLKTQVTHGLYVGHPVYTEGGIYARASCTCMLNQGDPMPDGLDRIYCPVLDFEFKEPRHGYFSDMVAVYADAKGFQDAKQRMGYKLFAAIHGQPIRLYTAKDLPR